MKVIVESVEKFAEDNFFMKVKPEKRLKFKAGQFVMIKIGNAERPFSIASFPGEETLDFLISTNPEGEITPKLSQMEKGDTFEIDGPFGTFTVKDMKAKEIIFIAAGTGIAPFRAMVVDSLQRFKDKKIKLIFGFRYDFYFEKFWRELEKKYKNFKIFPCCSRPTKVWKGLRGRVTEHLKEKIKDAKDKEVYVCGPPAMEQETREILENRIGFNKKQIRVEKWW